MTVSDFTAVINQLLPEPHAGLLNGILFGTKATLSKDFIDALTKTGTLHIVALSGMNITILGSLVDLTLLRFVSRRVSSVLTIAIIIGFVWFVGPSASVIRAALMGCLALFSVIFGRQSWSLFSFILTVGIMLIIKPDWIGDLSFQLSALATLGIILFGRTAEEVPSSSLRRSGSAGDEVISKISERSPLRQRRIAMTARFFYSLIADDLRITLAAQVFTIPLILFTFHRISLISPLTNILIGWIIPPLTALGMAVAIVGWIWLPLGQLIAWVSWLMLQYLFFVVDITAKLPFASIGF